MTLQPGCTTFLR